MHKPIKELRKTDFMWIYKSRKGRVLSNFNLGANKEENEVTTEISVAIMKINDCLIKIE